ncbi:MAG TPA: ribonuclease activity regulator RraA [Candidatus Latescibacteria bacterium]|jgi:regulator of RNase E activity RraA|nr:ribonuclease activity regulator RraA [Candidatus Latescibacterota bacterium]HJP33920.1 ribonuclease activity regulator RraA [Candidatus Latescibacterota bacterium]
MTTISQDTLDRLLVPSTATLTSVLKGRGLSNTFMHDVSPLKSTMKMAGRAFTLRYIPAREDLTDVPMDNLTDKQRVGIEQLTPGDVLVIDARGDTRAGTMGSILAERMHQLGAAGVVTDGAYRDSPTIAECGLAAYSRAMNAHTNKTIHYPSEIQVPVGCGEVAVFPGDIIVGDAEGVVVIPAHLADDVAAAAEEMESKEEFILARIRAGASLVGTYPPDEETLKQYERRDR